MSLLPLNKSTKFNFVEDNTNDISDATFVALVKRNARNIATALLVTPKVWGDPKRIKGPYNVALNDLTLNTRSGDIYIGRDCFFGHGCALLTGTHDPDKFGRERLKDVPTVGRDIIIEDGVWLASYVTVIGPARLGTNSAIAAGSLVIGDTLPGYLYAGRPAKIVRKLGVEVNG